MNASRRYTVGAVYSLGLHALLLAVFFIRFEPNQGEPSEPAPVPEAVKATVVDESEIDAEVEKLRQRAASKRLAEQEHQRRLEAARAQEEQRLTEFRERLRREQQQEQEERLRREQAEAERLAAVAERQAQEQARLSALAEAQRQEEARLVELTKQKEAMEKERLAQEQRIAELAATREAEAKKYQREQQQRALEAKKREEERQRQAAEAQRRKADEAGRAAQAAEQQAAGERPQRQAAAADSRAVIMRKVNRNWIRPPGTSRGLSCIVRVRLIPGGEVIEARVLQSSGNTPFDRSAERAVLKSSPLPLPDDPAVFEQFRSFDFRFRPDG